MPSAPPAAVEPTTALRCPECGAGYSEPDDSCEARFERLLALDHSRQEPWGPLHGLAFACFALQHPSQHITSTLERGWLMLQRIVVAGDDPFSVAQGMRRAHGTDAAWNAAPFPGRSAHMPDFTVTIASLGDFAAERYRADALGWARATLRGYGASLPAALDAQDASRG